MNKNVDETITFNGTEWPIRYVNIGDEIVPVSIIGLENSLIDDDDKYVSDQAKAIDEMIYCFVGTDEFYGDNLADYVKTWFV